MYALHGTGCFNDGKETLTNLFLTLGDIFDIKSPKFSRTFTDIKNRSKGEGVVFIEKMKKALLQQMEETEEKYRDRMKR